MRRSTHVQSNGFTLIELLVVIAIIGVLSSIVISSLVKARENSRIVATVSNLKLLRDSIEIYYAENGVYPDALSGWNGNGTCWGGTNSANYMPQLVSSGLAKLPLPQSYNHTGSCSNPMFLYYSNGNNYKLLSHNDIDTAVAVQRFPALRDPSRPNHAFGYWSQGGVGF